MGTEVCHLLGLSQQQTLQQGPEEDDPTLGGKQGIETGKGAERGGARL